MNSTLHKFKSKVVNVLKKIIFQKIIHLRKIQTLHNADFKHFSILNEIQRKIYFDSVQLFISSAISSVTASLHMQQMNTWTSWMPRITKKSPGEHVHSAPVYSTVFLNVSGTFSQAFTFVTKRTFSLRAA
jgi:hypothetical protein